MNAINRRNFRQSRTHALLLAAGMAVSAASAWARSPVEAEMDECVARAERYFGTGEASVYRAEVFRQNSGREVLTLDLELPGGVKPRFYCRLDNEGRVAQVNTLPRLPGHEDSMLVVK